ncbi:metallophosphoesterase family protein [Brevundimonas sp.]|uniref:metallophosphoesterase family protein n=1 Tax=Brevundimonas sp. TaxID=1871086 RepID=UPI00391A45DB
MFGRLFKSSASRPAEVPSDRVVWAIGDVHGRADLLAPLLEVVEADARGLPTHLVMLGDYVDRGRDSRGALQLLCDLEARGRVQLTALRGNHEDRMLAFLTEPQIGPSWCDYGGRDALASYQVASPAGRGDAEGWTQTARALGDALPEAHRRLLGGLSSSVEHGDYFFAHAGARPGIALEAQDPEDLMWIREPFLSDRRPFEKVVVHGHTPVDQPHIDARRINLDTGAYATGVLTALRLERDTRRFVQARAGGGSVRVSDWTPA